MEETSGESFSSETCSITYKTRGPSAWLCPMEEILGQRCIRLGGTASIVNAETMRRRSQNAKITDLSTLGRFCVGKGSSAKDSALQVTLTIEKQMIQDPM